MSSENVLLTSDEREMLESSVLVRHRLEEQFADLEQQHQASSMAMWVFLATEVMFFGVLFTALGAYHILYPDECEAASVKLCWQIGGANTIVLLVSSLTMALAVHSRSSAGKRRW